MLGMNEVGLPSIEPNRLIVAESVTNPRFVEETSNAYIGNTHDNKNTQCRKLNACQNMQEESYIVLHYDLIL